MTALETEVGREALAMAPAPGPANPVKAPPERLGRSKGFVSYFLAHGCAHLTLLCMAAVFLFPFLWMLGMSLKTDEEAASANLFPAIPAFRAESPYVRAAPKLDNPPDVNAERWAQLQPTLVAWARGKMAKAPLPAGAATVDAQSLKDAAAAELANRLIARLDKSVWTRSDAQVLLACAQVIDPADAAAVLNDRLARFELRGLQIRSLDGHVFRVMGGDIAQCWTVQSGPAEILPAGAGACCVHYHFASPDAAPVVLRCDFDSPITADQLHRIILPLNCDDSWNRIDATLELNGHRWKSTLSYYIAQFRPGSILLQPPTYQDSTPQPKTWIPLAPDGQSANGAPHATLWLTIRPSSTWQAILGKVERNYVRAFRSVPFFTYVFNSVLLVVLSMGGALFSASFVGYAFARLHWPGRGIAFAVLLSTMMLPAQVTMIPSFLIWRSLGWYNTLNPLWVGAWFGNAFFIFLMVQHMKTIPRELDEAARIDGLNAVQSWWYVILPQVKPTLAAIAILTFMGAWNDFMGPLIMLRDQDKFPLSLGLFGMRVDQGADWTMIMAGNMLMVLPVVVIFFLFQRSFVEGVTVSGMKG